MNENMIFKVAKELGKVPYEIKDVFLLVNCYSIQIVDGGHDLAGSQILSVRGSINLNHSQKMILLAEMIKRLELTSSEMMQFYSEIQNQQGWK